MKKLQFVLIIAVFLISSNLFAQGTFSKWPAIKTFHAVMSQTFHPAEDGNLEPIKNRSAEMVQKADDLSKSEIPTEFNNNKVLAAIQNLQIKSKALNIMIQEKATDEAITKFLSEIHDVFHEIVGLCANHEDGPK